MPKYAVGTEIQHSNGLRGIITSHDTERYWVLWQGVISPCAYSHAYIEEWCTVVTSHSKRNLEAPDYYVEGREYEPFHVINDWDLSFALGNVVKYISRCGRKTDDPIPDLEKARVYLDMEIKRLKGEND